MTRLIACLCVLIAASLIALPAAARTDPASFEHPQLIAIAEINSYLNAIVTLQGRFVQEAPDGRVTQGQFQIEKPGKLRFQYDPPAQMQIISDGLWVAIQDRKLDTSEKYPLVTTPLNLLLSRNVDLMRDARILDVQAGDDQVLLTLEERGPQSSGVLTLYFDPAAQELRRWTVTDVQGFDTHIWLHDVVTNAPVDAAAFRIIENRVLEVGGAEAR